ncbi:MAG: SprT-like domain-containing protein [Bacteroidota bacterium]
MKEYKDILVKYLPPNSVDLVIDLFEEHPCHLKIVNNRKTKHGDFKILADRTYQITLNYGLNPYRFLLTLVHEVAHLVTYKQYKRVKPHGIEWKRNFQRLMLPFFDPKIYPNELMGILANYMKNPKASTDADVNLSLALKNYDERNGSNYIFELPLHSKFLHNNRVFVKGEKRRTRHECTELQTGKRYLFHANAEVKQLKD